MDQSNRTLRKAYESPFSILYEVIPYGTVMSPQQTTGQNEKVIFNEEEWDW
jgi:hypothetical protein